MTLCFQTKLHESLQKIGLINYHNFLLQESPKPRTLSNSDQLIEAYGNIKWQIIGLLNQQYSEILAEPFNLYNWLNHNLNDEVAYFLNEAGSNCLNYSEHKIPCRFHLWFGQKGFIVGIEQFGSGFDAEKVHDLNIKENEGAGFDFFRNCRSKIFFNDKNQAKMILMEFLF